MSRFRQRVARSIIYRPPTGFADPYTTNFLLTENPMRESGIWTQGGTDGLDWKDMASASGKCFGTGASATYDDNIAAIQGRFNPQKHYVETVLVHPAGYHPAVAPEIEHHVGCTISAHSIITYEGDMIYDEAANTLALQYAHWLGVLGDVDVLSRAADMALISGTPAWTPQNGDIYRSEFDSTSGTPNVIFYINPAGAGVLTEQCRFRDTSGIAPTLTGSPGLGAFWRADASIDPLKLCFSRATLGSLP